MKRCPSCNLTFAETESFCPKDGAPLVSAAASYDPQATMMSPPPPPQQQQQGYYPNQSPQANQAPSPQWPQPQAPPNWQHNQQPGQGIPYATPQIQQMGKSKGLALASMILGIIAIIGAVGMIIMGFAGGTLFYIVSVLSLLSIIFGTIALLKATKNPARYEGKGLAITGIGASLAGLLVFVLIQTNVIGRSNSVDINISAPSSSRTTAPLATAIQGKWRSQYGGVYNFANGKWSATPNQYGSGSYKIVDEQTIDWEDVRLPGRPVRYTVTFAGDTMTMTDETGLKTIYTRTS